MILASLLLHRHTNTHIKLMQIIIYFSITWLRYVICSPALLPPPGAIEGTRNITVLMDSDKGPEGSSIYKWLKNIYYSPPTPPKKEKIECGRRHLQMTSSTSILHVVLHTRKTTFPRTEKQVNHNRGAFTCLSESCTSGDASWSTGDPLPPAAECKSGGGRVVADFCGINRLLL